VAGESVAGRWDCLNGNGACYVVRHIRRTACGLNVALHWLASMYVTAKHLAMSAAYGLVTIQVSN
jgi:hypothetical protein